MKRSVFLILTIVALAAISTVVAFFVMQPPRHPTDWLEKEYSLSGDRARQVEAMNRDYAQVCTRLCEEIRDSDARLADLLATSDRMTPAIREAVAETDRVRTECRTQMLTHFYEVAAVMPPPERARYLRMVYPLIQHPEEMGSYQVATGGR